MRALLRPHPDFGSAAVMRIEVEVLRTPATLILNYWLIGNTEVLSIPPPSSPERRDELWQHSCFEAFIRAADGYYEFNLSPSGEWNAYRFTGYRSGMEPAAGAEPPLIETQPSGDSYQLHAMIEVSGLAGLSPDADWRLGLSAVVEEKSGRKSYWALAHPPGKPDFHHSDCFALGLPPAAAS